MRIFTVLFLALFSLGSVAQDSKKVSLTITYKGSPLCYWDVTIKHGDVELAKGKTDDKGRVDFGYVRLLSNGIDAYGYKKTANGEKKWDVKGYITLNDQGHADFDFQPLVEETGMGSMLESAWGLTLNDCQGGSSSGTSMSSGESGSSSGNESSKSEGPSIAEQQKAEQEQWKEDWESGKTTAEGYQNQRAMYANKIDDLTRKINKKTEELNDAKPDSKEYSELSYEIKDMELEKQITELKLERTDKEIANGNKPLSKTERDEYKDKEESLKAQQKALKEKKDSGVRISESNNEDISGDSEEEFEKFTVYTAEEFASMGTMSLQKLKIEYQTKLGKRKTALKAKGSIMKDDKKALLEKEIAELERMIELMETELAKRKEEK